MTTATRHPDSCPGRRAVEDAEHSVLGLGTLFLFSVLEVFQGNSGASWIAVVMYVRSLKAVSTIDTNCIWQERVEQWGEKT